ncbi:hypothetical protein EW146_g6243 [Bondarzewia mesenterica]|uniref:Uncharacterized protein n=1 Tax=Bondarzewia mesenterica TaxID=1095465 RepID=A0A4S4LP45_9AGAM|nr:hypothetical protein EW146_g6243 [Bondarzewia mesenterica]
MRRGFLLDSTVRKTKENSASSPSAAKKPQSRPLLPIPTGPVIPSEIFPSPNLVFEELRRNYPNSQLGWVMSILPDIPPPTCEPWTTCLFLPGVKEALLSRPTFPSPFRSPPTRFCISAAPGAGLGMFATIDIQPGGLIAYERPLLIFPLALPYAGKGKGAHPEEVLRRVVYGQMPSAARTAFLQLKNSQTSDPAYIKGICDTNTIGISSMPGCKLRHGVVCDSISRINHRHVYFTLHG